MMLEGPRVAPAGGGKPNALIVLLHGYGSSGADLISLAPFWSKALPRVAFAAPNGPEPVRGLPGGYQWFDLGMRDPGLTELGARGAAAAIDRFLDRELARNGLDESRLALVGFSQGAMMALHVGVRRAQPPAAIVGFSGALVTGKLKEEARARPPILLIHGDRDERIPAEAMFQAAAALAEAELPTLWHLSPGVPHAIGPDGMQLAAGFLKEMLAVRASVSLAPSWP